MARQRSEADRQIGELLRTAKDALHLSVAFLTRMDGITQYLEVVESSVPFLFREGVTQRQDTTFCQAILDKKLPPVIPDVRTFPEAMKLPAARIPRIRSYVSVPVVLSDGAMYGTFCAAGLTSDKELTKRDQALMQVLAHAASVVIEPGVRERARDREIRSRLDPVVASGGPVVVLQAIVDMRTGHRLGAEALSRFPSAWHKPPDVCFGEAHSVGLGDQLELLALERAAQHLSRISGYLSMNVSPGTLLKPECARLLGRLPLERIVLELSEHDAVDDYDALSAVLGPLRARGMQLAIDDVGAGFSSLRHIVLTSPDVLKVDRSIISGVSTDPVLTTLVRSLVTFAHDCDARVVAEGIETAADAATLRALDVDFGQGWHYGRAGRPEDLADVPPPPVAMPPIPAARTRRGVTPVG